MKLEHLERASTLYQSYVCEQNNDTRLPDDVVEKAYKDFIKMHNLNQAQVEAYANIEMMWYEYLTKVLKQAKKDAVQKFIEQAAFQLDAKSDKRATTLFELATALEA